MKNEGKKTLTKLDDPPILEKSNFSDFGLKTRKPPSITEGGFL
jgi:hypothetical protein